MTKDTGCSLLSTQRLDNEVTIAYIHSYVAISGKQKKYYLPGTTLLWNALPTHTLALQVFLLQAPLQMPMLPYQYLILLPDRPGAPPVVPSSSLFQDQSPTAPSWVFSFLRRGIKAWQWMYLMAMLKVSHRTGIVLHPTCWRADVKMASVGQAQARLTMCIWHCCEFQLTTWKVSEAAGLKLQAGQTSVVTFQGNRGKHSYIPWQKTRCWRRSSPKQRGNCRKEQPLGLLLESDMQKGAHPASRVGEPKCRVP